MRLRIRLVLTGRRPASARRTLVMLITRCEGVVRAASTAGAGPAVGPEASVAATVSVAARRSRWRRPAPSTVVDMGCGPPRPVAVGAARRAQVITSGGPMQAQILIRHDSGFLYGGSMAAWRWTP